MTSTTDTIADCPDCVINAIASGALTITRVCVIRTLNDRHVVAYNGDHTVARIDARHGTDTDAANLADRIAHTANLPGWGNR